MDAFAPVTLSWMQGRRTPLVEDRFFSYLYVFGRLKPGASLEQAQAALAPRYRAIVTDVEAPMLANLLDGNYPSVLERFREQTLSLVSGARGQTRAPELARIPLAVFFAATATILLIACVNLANLMFARAATRIGEPNVMIHLDTYHMNIEENGLASGIRAAGAALRYIHLSESHRGVPGTGTVDWNATFAALAETGFVGDMVIESFVTLPPEIARALSVWRPVADSAEQVLRDGVPFLRDLARQHGLLR